MTFLLAAMISDFPYPHERTNVLFENGEVNPLAILPLALFIVGIGFLLQSFNKYKVRMVLLILLISSFVPTMTISGFQHTVASGIYAVSYDKENSECSYEMVDSTTLETECELIFENYSQNDVEFEVEFQTEKYDPPVHVFTLLNHAGPHDVHLKARERETIRIKETIPLSTKKKEFGGQSSFIDVNLRTGDRERRL
ncbi:hypothetical protein GCM10010954_09820 [Halobacillus andaensis]|uniref:Uncharacterized protein n=1 Tax=Halobacillus andaensis TaxID=1176239 RepID=A0A917EUB3_HALAA|nr:hypothetical protein [Halobacillus andaensis]MBP2003775.1 hypothetical protein [Halobacillus andaensis]GGF13159.1 hypothetical protein GCM10010954_09820 [Halobacillus andaensis]